jgi:translocation and assembly module TamB
MSRRWAWWAASGLLVVVLLGFGAWRFSREIPDRLREAEEAIREEAARNGLQVSFRGLKFHLLYPRVSMDDLEIRDAQAGLRLLWAEAAEISLSPGRLLSGESPVSRIRIRNYTLHLEEANRPLFERLRAVKREGAMPEMLLLGGTVRIGPLGPVKRWEAKIPELRLREVKFLGTRITLKAEEATGEVVLPETGAGNWPFVTLEADLFLHQGAIHVRKLHASGPSATLRLSGLVDSGRRSGDVKLSGEADLARWVSSGAPASAWIGRLATIGNVDFSASLEGTMDNPDGSVKFLLRNGRLRGGAPAEAELEVSVGKRQIRMGSLKGKIWGGTLTGNGSYDLGSGRVEGKLSLNRVSFGAVPWKEWGLAWRPAGTGDAEIVLSGGRDRVHGVFSWKNPAGLERVVRGKEAGETVRLPFSGTVDGDYLPGGVLTLAKFRVRAGEAELSGEGAIDLPVTHIRLDGELSIPRGKALEYGWNAPVSWGSVSGGWKIEGAADRFHVEVRLDAQEISAWGLPPIPLMVKLVGYPADAVHFVADIPAKVAKTTATGTFTGPLSGKPFLVEASLAAREIDFSEGGRWLRAVMASLGKDPAGVARYTAGLAGSGNGDLQVSLGKETSSITGTLRSGELRLAGFSLGDVSAEVGWSRSGTGESWKVGAQGKTAGEGEFRLTGEGQGGAAKVSGAIDRLDLGKVLPLFASGSGLRVQGTAGLRFASRFTGREWELDSFSASVPRLSVDNVAWEGVSAEGSLGLSSGRLVVASRSPEMRLNAEVGRGGDWPVSFAFSATDVPAGFVLSAAGHPGVASKGKWNAGADGVLKAAMLLSEKTFPPGAVSTLRFSASSSSPSISSLDFEELRAAGRKEGDALVGEISSRAPDSRLSFSLALREPFAFRVEGPLSFGTVNGKGKEEGKAKLSVNGSATIAGALRSISSTTGTLMVHQFVYKDGGFEMSGKEISARFLSEGIRWAGGTLLAAGSPLDVSGKVSWKGDLDVHVDGSVPAAAIRLLTDVFDRLDGVMRLNLRLTGKWDDPTLVGTGRLDGGTFSFRGYSQLFEGMKADAVISMEKIIFEHFEGRSGGGFLDGRGELPLRFDAHQRLYFTVDFFDMMFPYPDEFRPVLQGHVELLGPYDDFLVLGEVEVQSARYTRTLRAEKALVDFRRRLVDVTARKENSGFRVRLDVDGIADGTIRIKNNIADATARGEFKIVGDVSRVIILGSFDVNEGFVEYQGNRYDLKRVSVDFLDPRRNNPRLEVRAETKKGNVTVMVSVSGTLEKYEVDLTSDPPLGKNDIVSLLSLGVTTKELVGSEGTVSAAAASTVVLGPYKGRVEERIRGVVRLDKFSIEPSYSSSNKSFEPKFIVGKSFGDRFSVSVSTSVGTTTDSSATAEYKLLENVYLQGAWESATTSKEGDLGADIKIRYRYRQLKDFLRDRD